jgi:XTP/dITP diphosphohydrolase
MLREMKGQKDRRARFRTVIAFFDGGRPLTFEGEIRGNIAHSASGDGGFGYDPIFMPEGHEKTFAAFSPEEKNRISHRGIAVQRFAAFLKASYQAG